MKIVKKLISGRDYSIKYLFRLKDDNTIEALYMYDREFKLTYHSTVCVSSQVGCKLGCAFCATGKQGFIRNLGVDEIVGQVVESNHHCLKAGIAPIDAVVFAGMGEPLLNYANVKKSVERVYSDLGINNFELATVGVVPQIYRLINEFIDKKINIRLNISLHASSNEMRKKLIPYNAVYNIDEIIKASDEYARAFNSKVRIRYMLFEGLNDTEQDIQRLCKLLADKPVKLVMSQYNENNIPGLRPASWESVLEFQRKINRHIDTGVFRNFGSDIRGGCGQLSGNVV